MPSKVQSGAARPRLAIFSPIFTSPSGAHGGITTVIRGLLDGFAKIPVDVDLLVRTDTSFTTHKMQLPPNVRVRPIGRRGRTRECRRVSALLRQGQYQALLTAGHRFNVVGIRAALAAEVRVVASVHNHVGRQLAGRGNILRRWRRAREIARVYPLAHAIVAVSEGVATDLRARVGSAGDRVLTIPNPVVSHTDGDTVMQEPPHPWLATPREKPVLLAAGRLTVQKDYRTMLRALARVRARRDCRLIILGEGEERTALEQLAAQLGISDVVDLVGFHREPRRWMAAADLFVLSSAWEGFGNVLVEAMSAGTPVVSTDCPSGPAEILQHGRVGRLVPVGDDAALADAIAATLADPPSRNSLINATAPFRSSVVARSYLNVLELDDSTRLLGNTK